MNMTVFRSNLPIAAALIVASGCGLSDYQSRMDAQRVRVQEFDESNVLLDDPLDMPTMQINDKDKAAWLFDVYLRLPSNYGTQPKDKDPHGKPFPFFRFAGGKEGAHGIFVTAAFIVGDPKGDDEWGKYHTASFGLNIKNALERYYSAINKTTNRLQEVARSQKDVKLVGAYPDPDKGVKTTFQHIVYSDAQNKQIKDHSAFDVYIYETSLKQVCIVVHRPMNVASPIALNKSIEACLGSLDVSNEAGSKRSQFKKTQGR